MPGPFGTPGTGAKSFIQWSPEAAYAQGGSPATRKLEIISHSLEPQIGVIPDPSLYNGVSRRAMYQGGRLVKGSIVVRWNYDGLLDILRGVFGAYNGPVVGGETIVSDHIFTEAQTLKSHRLELIEGDVGGSTLCQVVPGAKFPGLTIKGTAGAGADAMLTGEISVLGKDLLPGQARTVSIVTGAVCATTNGSATVTRASGDFNADGVRPGMLVTGTNVPADTYVFTVDSATQITLGTLAGATRNATGTGSSLVMTFTPVFPQLLPVLFHQASTTDDGSVDGGLNTVVTAGQCTTTSGSPTLGRSAGSFITDGVRAGMTIVGTGIPAGTYVGTVNSATSITMAKADGTNQNATATGSSLVMTFTTGLRLRSFEVSIDNPHSEDRFYLGSVNIDEPLRSDFLKVTWKLTTEFANLNMLNAAMAFTTCSPQLIFRHPTTIGSTSKREFELRSNQAQITSFSKPIQAYGVILSTITLEAFLDPTDASALLARVRNVESTLT